MRIPWKVLVASIALAAAAPAAAQYVFKPAWQEEKEEKERLQELQEQSVQRFQRWYNVARVNLGVSFFYSEYYNCNYWYGFYPTYGCGSSGSWVSYVPFTVGPQVDIHLQGMNNISVGFNVFLGSATGTVYSGALAKSVTRSVTIWEPTVDYVAKFGPPSNTAGRFRVGGGMYIGPNSELGGAFRIGGGVSFLNLSRFGIGLDLVLEGGGYAGYWIGGLQLMASPEFHF